MLDVYCIFGVQLFHGLHCDKARFLQFKKSGSIKDHSLTVHSTLSYRTAKVRYNTRTIEISGDITMEKLVRYNTLSYRIAIVRQSTRTIAQNPGTVRLC
jgi:hypothetical protein